MDEALIFISYARSDLEAVRPIVNKLEEAGFNIWFDEKEIAVGEDIATRLNEGLRLAKRAVVFLSPTYLERGWTELELGALLSKEAEGKRVVIPVLHGMSVRELGRVYPLLAGRIVASTNESSDKVAKIIANAIKGIAVASLLTRSRIVASRSPLRRPRPC